MPIIVKEFDGTHKTMNRLEPGDIAVSMSGSIRTSWPPDGYCTLERGSFPTITKIHEGEVIQVVSVKRANWQASSQVRFQTIDIIVIAEERFHWARSTGETLNNVSGSKDNKVCL